ncbi:MAG: phosphatase PAP2 family protein [Acidobacteria bacterium]|nr:phosphatase PAP2 family protein [Acidobacteriota bacterium]
MTPSAPAPSATAGRPALLPQRFLFGASLLLFVLTLLFVTANLDLGLLLEIYRGAHADWLQFWVAVTDVGSNVFLATVVVIFAVMLAIRRRYDTALWLVAGWLLTSLTVELVRWLVGKARPSVPFLATAGGASFPSGHAAQSLFVFYFLWILLAGSTVMRNRGWVAASARELCSVALAVLPALIGYSRVYLGVHWPSDVLGGWALGFFMLGVSFLGASGRGETPPNHGPRAY